MILTLIARSVLFVLFGQDRVPQRPSPRRNSHPVRIFPPYTPSERPRCPRSQTRADWSTRRPCRTWAAPNPASSLRAYQSQPLPARQRCRPIADQLWSQRSSMWQMIGWRMTWVMCSLRRSGEFLSKTSHGKQLSEIRIISQSLLKFLLEVCDIPAQSYPVISFMRITMYTQ